MAALPKNGQKSGDPQPISIGASKLLGSEGAEKSSYGTFLSTEESTNSKSPGSSIPSSLAFINVSYEVPQTFGWLPGKKHNIKTILKPARY